MPPSIPCAPRRRWEPQKAGPVHCLLLGALLGLGARPFLRGLWVPVRRCGSSLDHCGFRLKRQKLWALLVLTLCSPSFASRLNSAAASKAKASSCSPNLSDRECLKTKGPRHRGLTRVFNPQLQVSRVQYSLTLVRILGSLLNHYHSTYVHLKLVNKMPDLNLNITHSRLRDVRHPGGPDTTTGHGLGSRAMNENSEPPSRRTP